jgi:uncharacterized membrane protein YfhO
LIAAYSILLIFHNSSNTYKGLIAIVLIAQTLYVTCTSVPTKIEKENLSYDKFVTDTIKYRVNSIDEDDFINKNMYTNEKSTYLFTSMTYTPVLNMVGRLGCQSGGNSITCHKRNELFNMIFNVKNDYYLEKIYSVDKDIANVILDELSVKKAQEDLIKSMTGITEIFDKETLKADVIDGISNFKTDKSFYLIDSTYNGVTINYVQDYREFKFENTDDTILEEVNIYTLNKNKMNKVYSILKNNQIEYTHYSDSHIEGIINVDSNQMIFTSIPYDESWEITIDGKKTKPVMILESLIGIECKPGKHTITMKYKTNYTVPIIISSLTFIGLIISIIIKNKKNED